MAIVVARELLTEADKTFLRDQLTISSNTDPPVVVKPFKAVGEVVVDGRKVCQEVWLPMAFYQELRLHGGHNDWPLHPNDALHPGRFGSPFNFKGELRPQQQAVWTELYNVLRVRRTVLLAAHTGFGKTALSAYVASKAQLITLILYHIAPLGRSWPQTFDDFTDASYCHINHQPFNPDAQIYIATVGAALSDKFPLDVTRVGLLIIDEAHCFASPQRIFSLLRFQPKYLVLLTATPDKANGLGKLLGLFHGRLDETKPLEKQVPVSVSRIASRPFTVYRCQTTFRPVIKSTPRGLDWQEVKNSLIEKPELVKLICDWVTLNPHKKVLVPCIQVSQVRAIADELRSRGEAVATMHGDDSTYDDQRVLVATMGKCQLGFDDKTCARGWDGQRLNMIVLPWTVKDKGVIEQLVGRMRGDGGVVCDIVNNFASFTKHFKARAEWYLSHGGVVEVCNTPKRLD